MKKKRLFIIYLSMMIVIFIQNDVYAQNVICDTWSGWKSLEDTSFLWMDVYEDGTYCYDVYGKKVYGEWEESEEIDEYTLLDSNGEECGYMNYEQGDEEYSISESLCVNYYDEDGTHFFHSMHRDEERESYKTYMTSENTINFKGFDFGTDYDTVFESVITSDMKYGVDYYETGNMISIMNDTVGGYDTSTLYVFEGDKLVTGMYSITELHSNDTQYYYDYCDLVEKYTKKYGEPFEKREKWIDDLYKDNQEDWGMAIITGDVEFTTIWSDDNQNGIVITLEGDNYEPSFYIAYISGELTAVEDMEGI